MRTISWLALAIAFLQPLVLSQVVVPQWTKDAVWYQIVPERFRNGDRTNNPTLMDLDIPPARAWTTSFWTADWYELQSWEKDYSKAFYDNVPDRRYGGDLQGVIGKLDYLSDIGVTAITFTPVFDAISDLKSDASTYHHIDRNFGPDPRGDAQMMNGDTDNPATWKWTSADTLFLKLLREAHKRGMKVIIDGVFSHCGARFWAFRDVMKSQQKSPYAGWFNVKHWDDPATPLNEFTYKSWKDLKDLPEFWEGDSGFVKSLEDYFFNITRRWMDPNGDGDPSDGIDGWTLDAADKISHVFWKRWRSLVKSINPSAYVVGEIRDDASKWLAGDEFDAVTNERYARAMVRFIIDTDSRHFSASEFDRELAKIRRSYSDEANFAMMNLIDSHDTDRLGSMILNPNRTYNDQNSLKNNPNYNVGRPTTTERVIQRLIVLFQMSSLGAPMIYYGDEAGMWGADDPDNRKPMLWADLNYENERLHPIPGKSRTDDEVRFDRGLYDYYRLLVRVRKQSVALRRGDFVALITDDKNGVYVFKRTAAGDEAIVMINNSWEKRSVDVSIEGSWAYRDEIAGKVIEGKDHLVRELNPKAGTILTRKR
jgi:cyclomaltodextrinase